MDELNKKEEDKQVYRTFRNDTKKIILEKKGTSWDKKRKKKLRHMLVEGDI